MEFIEGVIIGKSYTVKKELDSTCCNFFYLKSSGDKYRLVFEGAWDDSILFESDSIEDCEHFLKEKLKKDGHNYCWVTKKEYKS